MIIELVGLPGAGKTTFAKQLCEDKKHTLVRINGRSELLYYNLLFLFAHPYSWCAQLVWLFRHKGKPSLWYTKFTNLFLVHNAKYMKARQFRRAIIDQGHHQNILSLFDEVVDEKIINAYLRILPKPDLLCFLLVDDETRATRLHSRGYDTRDEEDESYRRAWEEAYTAHFEYLYISRNTLSCLLETITPQDQEEKCKKIAEAHRWYFVMHARMPTEKAHGLQIAKTLEALTANGEYATLWIPRRTQKLSDDITAYYGLNPTFPVRRFGVPNFLRLSSMFGPFAFWLDALGFMIALSVTHCDKEGIYYTRNAEIAWLFKRHGCRVFFEAHVWPSSKRSLLKYFLRNIDGIICNSEGTANAYRQAGLKNIHVVRNGVDLDAFLIETPAEEARALLGLPQQKKIVMYVGAFYAWKGVPFLLDTWKMYFQHNEDILLVLVGGGEKELTKEGGYDSYRACANILLIPHETASRIPLYLRAADVLVLPNQPLTEESSNFTSPIKLFEYMASGRPIIASDLPSIREILGDENGLLAAPKEHGALASGISSLLAHRGEASQYTFRARSMVMSYSWSARADRISSVVSNVLSSYL